MKHLTDKTINVLKYISYFQTENGYTPSIIEIGKGVNINSIRGVTLQLDKLQKLGYIQRDKNSRRAIKIITFPDEMNSSETIRIPLLGEVKAGYNALANEIVEDYFDVPLSIVHGRRDAFLLRVKGNSMINAGIRPGDLVVISPQTSASNGDIVLAFDSEDETGTLKRFKKMENFILLLPESDDPTYQPKIGRHFIIQGVMVNKYNGQ